jgi:putative methionine-R-sulfoxide reductase with GAF domain
MEDAAKLTENQLNFTDALEPDDVLSVQASSPHWPEIASRLDTLTKEIAVALAAKAAYLYILDEKRQLLRPYFSWPVRTSKTYFTEQAIGAGIAGLAAQSKRLVRVNKPKNKKPTEPDWPHQSALAVPLTIASAEQPVGVLVVADKINQLAFSPQDEQLLLSLVNQADAALTIKNANLVHRKRDRGQELTILSQISQTLNNSLHLMDVDSVCQAILQIPDLKDIFQFDVAEICLWNPQAKILTTALRMVDGSPDVQAYARTYHLNEGYTGWIATHQKSLLIEDTQRYTETTPRAGLAN